MIACSLCLFPYMHWNIASLQMTQYLQYIYIYLPAGIISDFRNIQTGVILNCQTGTKWLTLRLYRLCWMFSQHLHTEMRIQSEIEHQMCYFVSKARGKGMTHPLFLVSMHFSYTHCRNSHLTVLHPKSTLIYHLKTASSNLVTLHCNF